jgi:hypothetical protein
VLFFLSPIIGELLSGSAPPVEFFNPFSVLVLSILYGGGAVLIREAKVRWRKDFTAILLLGAAYGIAEEGLFVKSFFDPNWMDLEPLANYGRIFGINLIWAIYLTFYHMVVSIAVPIALVELLYPEKRGKPWLTDKGVKLLFLAFVFNGAFIFLALNPYSPPLIPYLFFLVLTILIVKKAKQLPPKILIHFGKREASEKKLVVLGFLLMSIFFFGLFGLPNFLSPILNILTTSLSIGIVVVLILRYSLNWKDKHSWAFCFGILLFFIILAPLQELDKSRPDNTSGMTLVGLAVLIFLLWLRHKIVKRELFFNY